MSEIKSMEHSTLKVPYEILNKKFRTTQKTLDREFDQIQSVAKDIKTAMSKHQQPSISEVNRLVGSMVKRIQVLKRKASDSIMEESQASSICKKKLDHLKAVIPNQNINPDIWLASLDQWKRTRMDRVIIEHMLRMGYYETADRLANKSDLRHLSNFETFQISREIEEDLAAHNTSKCIMWCIDNKSKLRKINSNIEFNLRVQEFVEFIRNNKRVDAVLHSRKYFPAYEKTQLKEICKCMALLALNADTNIEPYKSLFDIKRWDELLITFRNENFRLFQLSNHSLLTVAVQAGLSALKTPQCYIASCRNINCPVCQEDMNSIAKNLPFSHCVQSRLICRITGLPLNEHNLPMMLPNGQIFGQLAIPEITKENGTVVCPITNTKFLNPKIEKVFIM